MIGSFPFIDSQCGMQSFLVFIAQLVWRIMSSDYWQFTLIVYQCGM